MRNLKFNCISTGIRGGKGDASRFEYRHPLPLVIADHWRSFSEDIFEFKAFLGRLVLERFALEGNPSRGNPILSNYTSTFSILNV